MKLPRTRGEELCVGLTAAVRPLLRCSTRALPLSVGCSPSLCKTYVGGEHIAEWGFRNVIRVRGRLQSPQVHFVSSSPQNIGHVRCKDLEASGPVHAAL